MTNMEQLMLPSLSLSRCANAELINFHSTKLNEYMGQSPIFHMTP